MLKNEKLIDVRRYVIRYNDIVKGHKMSGGSDGIYAEWPTRMTVAQPQISLWKK